MAKDNYNRRADRPPAEPSKGDALDSSERLCGATRFRDRVPAKEGE